MTELSVKPSHRVEFVLTDAEYWLIYNADMRNYVYTNRNTWGTNISNEREFPHLHDAIAVARKKGLNYKIPDYKFIIDDKGLNIFLDFKKVRSSF